MSEYAHSETAAIDHWIEAAEEPEPQCRLCGHVLELHDERGCFSVEGEIGTEPVIADGFICDCKGFE